MSFVTAAPQAVTVAAGDLAGIGSAIDEANAAAAARTTNVAAAAGDEVSAQLAGLFGAHARRYQALGAEAAAFHDAFVQTLLAGGGSYARTEAANVQQTLLDLVNAPTELLLGRPLIGQGAAAGRRRGRRASRLAARQRGRTRPSRVLVRPVG